MKRHVLQAVCTGLLMLTFGCKNLDSIRPYAPVETFPNDTILGSIQEKRAMIVVAHDDDMCATSGTVSKLNKQGWKVAVVSFSKTPERNAAQVQACKAILDTVMFVDLTPSQIRNDDEAKRQSYYAFPKDSFDIIFNKPLIEAEYLKRINHYNPTVIFTLDSDMGGYGHPEHVLVSQMVVDLAQRKLIRPAYIYQSVFTDHMENTIMERHRQRMISWGFPGDEWANAKKIYGVDGMPAPSVQVDISSEAKEKMAYLRSYNKRERKVLGFFMPSFEKFPAKKYFSVFDREFFRIIRAE